MRRSADARQPVLPEHRARSGDGLHHRLHGAARQRRELPDRRTRHDRSTGAVETDNTGRIPRAARRRIPRPARVRLRCRAPRSTTISEEHLLPEILGARSTSSWTQGPADAGLRPQLVQARPTGSRARRSPAIRITPIRVISRSRRSGITTSTRPSTSATTSTSMPASTTCSTRSRTASSYSSYPISAMGRYFYLGATMNFGDAGR